MAILTASQQKQLREVFGVLPRTVTLLLFVNTDEQAACGTCQDAHDLIDELAALSDGKVRLEVHDLAERSAEATLYGIDKAQALVVLGDDSGRKDAEHHRRAVAPDCASPSPGLRDAHVPLLPPRGAARTSDGDGRIRQSRPPTRTMVAWTTSEQRASTRRLSERPRAADARQWRSCSSRRRKPRTGSVSSSAATRKMRKM